MQVKRYCRPRPYGCRTPDKTEDDMKALLAVDGSEFTKRMLAWLAVHSEVLGEPAEHVFITVIPALPPHVSRYIDETTEQNYYEEQAQSVFGPIVEFGKRHGWTMSQLAPVGRAAEEIVKAAEQNHFDVIVMGSHGHSPIGSLVLGSVAQRVLASCKTPVLIVR
jgi:nucleotide-binding universal stress UspA family protein